MKIAVIGGGPAGLFFARLTRRREPGHEIRIFEQNPENATYGFGVTLAGAAQDRLHDADGELMDRLAGEMVFNNEQAIRLNGRSVLLKYAAKGGALPRLALLRIMEDLCREVGLTVEHEHRIETPEDFAGFDLVVGADGANSVVRRAHADFFGVRTRVLDNRFAWYGVRKALKPNALSFKATEGGVFIGHYYAYSDRMSTFVAEVDARTWENGVGAMTDDERKVTMERIFAEELEGERLVENKSVWRAFPATVNDHWFHGNAVLIGDALRVAHPSIGSGTRLAMDDALALHASLAECGDDVPSALARFVERRKPTRDLFTEATVRSFEWYEDVGNAMGRMEPIEFAHDFLTRTGRIDDQRLQSYAPDFYQQYRAFKDARQAAHAG